MYFFQIIWEFYLRILISKKIKQGFEECYHIYPIYQLFPFKCLTKMNPKYTQNNCFCSFFILLNQKQRPISKKVFRFRISYLKCWKLWVLRLCIPIFRLIGLIFREFCKRIAGSSFFWTTLYLCIKFLSW